MIRPSLCCHELLHPQFCYNGSEPGRATRIGVLLFVLKAFPSLILKVCTDSLSCICLVGVSEQCPSFLRHNEFKPQETGEGVF